MASSSRWSRWSRSLPPGLLCCPASRLARSSAWGAQTARSLEPAGGTRPCTGRVALPRLSCSGGLCSGGTGENKEQQRAPHLACRAFQGAHWRLRGLEQRLTPASVQTRGRGSDGCPAVSENQLDTGNKCPGISKMGSRWLLGTRFPNIPSSCFTPSPVRFPFEGG